MTSVARFTRGMRNSVACCCRVLFDCDLYAPLENTRWVPFTHGMRVRLTHFVWLSVIETPGWVGSSKLLRFVHCMRNPELENENIASLRYNAIQKEECPMS